MSEDNDTSEEDIIARMFNITNLKKMIIYPYWYQPENDSKYLLDVPLFDPRASLNYWKAEKQNEFIYT